MVDKSSPGESAGFLIPLIILAICFALILPATLIMYIDILTIRGMVQEELKKTVRFRKQMQAEQLEKKKAEEEK